MKLEDYSKYYIQGTDHYLIPKDIFTELFNEMINWKQENQELKEQMVAMNKETLLFFIKATLEDEKHLGDNLKKQCIDYVESLHQENKQLKEVIDKAIKYIQENTCWELRTSKVLEILKEVG